MFLIFYLPSKKNFINKLTSTISKIYNTCTVVRISNNVILQTAKTNLQSFGGFGNNFLSNILKIFILANYLRQFNLKSAKLFEMRR